MSGLSKTIRSSFIYSMERVNVIFDGNYLIHKCFSVWSLYYQDRKKSPEENDQIISNALKDKEKQQVFLL